MTDCIACCAVPRLSVSLSVVVAVCFLVITVLNSAFPGDEVCKCELGRCCTENAHDCFVSECLCWYPQSNERVCEDKEKQYSPTVSVFVALFFLVGIGFLVASLISCCCCGHLQAAQRNYLASTAQYQTDGNLSNSGIMMVPIERKTIHVYEAEI